MENAKPKSRKYDILRLIFASILIFVMIVSMFFQNSINDILRLRTYSKKVSNFYSDSTEASVHFVPIDRGYAVIINLPDGKTMLVDSGPMATVDVLEDYIASNLVQNNDILSQNENFAYFDYVIMTTSLDSDIGGMYDIATKYISSETKVYRPNVLAVDYNDENYLDPGVFDHAGSEIIYDPYTSHNSLIYRNILDEIYNKDAKVLVNSNVPHYIDISSDYHLTIIPYADRDTLYGDYDLTAASPIILIEYGDTKLIYLGTSNIKVLNRFKDEYSNIYGDDLDASMIILGNNFSPSAMTESLADFLLDAFHVHDTTIVMGMSAMKYNDSSTKDMLSRLYDLGIESSNVYTSSKDGVLISSIDNINTSIVTNRAKFKFSSARPYGLWWNEYAIGISVLVAIIFLLLGFKAE